MEGLKHGMIGATLVALVAVIGLTSVITSGNNTGAFTGIDSCRETQDFRCAPLAESCAWYTNGQCGYAWEQRYTCARGEYDKWLKRVPILFFSDPQCTIRAGNIPVGVHYDDTW